MHEDLATPAGTTRVLRKFGIRPRKRWGQHFLVSRHALDRILAAAALSKTDTVLEVGAGLGTLTVALAAQTGRVIAVEVDRALLPALETAVAPHPNVTVVRGDVLSLDLDGLLAGSPGSRKVVANLPYYLASALIVSFLERPVGFARMVFTVQREVAERMIAPPGGKDYGALSVAVQYRARVSIAGRVPPSAFLPAPDVESAIVLLEVRDRAAVAVHNEAHFFRVVRAAFGQRRKTLRNALAAITSGAAEAEAACLAAGVDPGRRGETLSLEEFAALADAVAARASQR